MMYILILLASVWGVIAWRRPRWAVLCFPALLPVYLLRTKIGPLPTTLLEFLWLATLLGVTLRRGWGVWIAGFIRTRPWRIGLILWCLATALAVAVAPDHIAALGLWRAYVLEPIVYFILLNGYLQDEKDRRMVINSLIAAVAFIAAWTVMQFVTGRGIPHPWDTNILTRRATGPFPFPNAVALFCASIAALCFGFALFDAPRFTLPVSRFWLWLGFICASVATLLAKSLGGSLAILSAVFVALVIKRKTRWYAVAAALLGILLILGIPVLRGPAVKTLSFHDWSGKVRLIMWQETWHMLKDRPLLGAGLGAYPTVFKPYHKATYIEIFQYPHDILLNLWSETGLLGILAFGWIVATWLGLANRQQRSDERGAMNGQSPTAHGLPYLLPLLVILIHGLVDVPYFKNDLAFLFWILVALATLPSDYRTKSGVTPDST